MLIYSFLKLYITTIEFMSEYKDNNDNTKTITNNNTMIFLFVRSYDMLV